MLEKMIMREFYQPKFGCLRYSQTLTKLTQRRLCTGWVYRVALMV
jgi:hypothetical protein